MESVYEAALKRVDELQDELKSLNDFIMMHRRSRQLLGLDSVEHKGIAISSEAAQGALSQPTFDAEDSDHKRARVTDNPKPSVVVEAALRIIREHGRPMSRRDLHAALMNEGLEVKGSDPIKALGTMLWRAPDHLVQLNKLGYWLKDTPYLPAFYDPDPTYDMSDIDVDESEPPSAEDVEREEVALLDDEQF